VYPLGCGGEPVFLFTFRSAVGVAWLPERPPRQTPRSAWFIPEGPTLHAQVSPSLAGHLARTTESSKMDRSFVDRYSTRTLSPSVSGVPSRLEELLVAPTLWERLVLTNQYTFSVAIGAFPAPAILTRFSAYLPTGQQKPIVSTAEPIALTVGTYLSDSAGEAATSGFET
jgi:hypothetical protein